MDARAAALSALLAWQRHGTFTTEWLSIWNDKDSPKTEDMALARELASGTLRLKRLLDTFATSLVDRLPTKTEERWIVRLALYQALFCTRIPDYAIVATTKSLVQQFCHPRFSTFASALAHRACEKRNWQPSPELPLAERTSYTDFLVSLLITAYGEEKVAEILARQNRPSPLMCRPVKNSTWLSNPPPSTRPGSFEVPMLFMDDPSLLKNLEAHAYVQNASQVEGLTSLAKALPRVPSTILDLCAAPGGKSLMLAELFPHATLICNEPNASRCALLESNLARFNCQAGITRYLGEEYPTSHLFDLIVIDAPCSNSGVLYKCPEARWRIEKDALWPIVQEQRNLLQHSRSLLAPGGAIFYMTCSILPQENEKQMHWATNNCALSVLSQRATFPDDEGREGGFAALLTSDTGGNNE